MPNITRRAIHACPKCHLALTVITTSNGPTVEYDAAEWARTCHRPDLGSPLACPWVKPLLDSWFGRS